MISVIIPCYNAQSWIRDCLLSVLNQTYIDFEILVIDDGSTDNSAEIIKSIADQRIHYYYKTNGGLSSARNYGLKIAKGKWIAFLDADDLWIPNKLQKKMTISENADIIYSDYHIIDKNAQLIKTFNKIHPQRYKYNFKKQILLGNIISGGSAIILRKEVIEEIGEFNTALKVGEDWDYWARAIWANYRIIYIDEKLTYVRQHEESMQKITGKNIWNNSVEIILKSFLLYNGISNKEKSYVYKKLTTVAYGANYNTKKYLFLYRKCISLNKKMIFDNTLLWLTFKYSIKRIKNKLHV
nr:glycosyltransferase [uncultured Pedobacter sp.]